MEVNFLLKDELEFELACRGVKITGTVPVMKKVLQELILREQDGSFSRDTKAVTRHTGVDAQFELEICSAKLKVLSNYIAEIVGRPDKVIFRRLVTRLYHVENRLNLFQSETEDLVIRKDGLMQQCQVLLEKLEKQDDEVEEENLTAEDKAILHQTLGELGAQIIKKIEAKEPESGEANHRAKCNQVLRADSNRGVSFTTGQWQEEVVSRPKLTRFSTIDEDFPVRKLVPIYQWGVKFSGSHDTSVNAFIERVEELKEARNASDLDLWRYAIDFFEGDALIWYRANKEYASNWEDLVILLKRTFQRPFYQEELMSEIKQRTQGQNESVLIYVSIMQNMFKRLPNKITEREKIVILLRNLQPYYQRAICRDEFSSIPDLLNVLRVIERTKITCDNFQEPQPGGSMEPDLAYKIGHPTDKNPSHQIEELSETNRLSRRCWNCRETGHTFRDCSMPKQRLFCFKCGRFGVTSSDCKCTGNVQGGSSQSAS